MFGDLGGHHITHVQIGVVVHRLVIFLVSSLITGFFLSCGVSAAGLPPSPLDDCCNATLVPQCCQVCNTSLDCSPSFCIKCPEILGTPSPGLTSPFKPDPLGKIISLSLLVTFLIGLSLLCLRVCASLCSWKKCCVCQCSVAIHCCCDPKVPSLRVTPASSDAARDPRNTLHPAPPPSYQDLFPEPTTSQPHSLAPPQLLDEASPNSVTSFQEVSSISSGSPLQEVSSLTNPLQEISSLSGDPFQEVSHLQEVDSLATPVEEPDDFDWHSIASFPAQDEVEQNSPRARAGERWSREASREGEPRETVFTVENTQRLRANNFTSFRPTTC